MKLTKLENLSIRPTEKKMKKVKKVTEELLNITGAEVVNQKAKSVSKNIFIPSDKDVFEFSKKTMPSANDIFGKML